MTAATEPNPQPGALLDLLSEILTVERDGMRLYRDFLGDAPASLQPKIIEYAEQSRRSVLLIEQAITELGGDPAYVSPGAEVAHRLNEAVLAATETCPVHRWMYRLLHIVAYEQRNQLIWETLDRLGKREPGEKGEVLHSAARAVRSEEALGAHMADTSRERIRWALNAMDESLTGELELGAPPAHWWQRLFGSSER